MFTQTGGTVSQGTSAGYEQLSVQNGSRYEQSGGTLNVPGRMVASGGSRYSIV